MGEKKNGRSSIRTSKDVSKRDSANESDSKHYTTSSGRKYKKFLNGHKDEKNGDSKQNGHNDRDSDDVRKVKSHSRERYERNSRDRDRSDNNKKDSERKRSRRRR